MWNEWLVVLLSSGLTALFYFLVKLSTPKGKSIFGFHNYLNIVFSILCLFFTLITISIFILATVHFFLFILTL